MVAVDVGYGQLDWSLQQDPRVRRPRPAERPRAHARHDRRPVDLVVGDLSFISLSLVLDALLGVTRPDGDLALMVKPQFEVGKDRVGKGGVVRDPALRAEAVLGVAAAAAERGWGTHGVTVSPLPGPSGNVEFFLWLRRGPATVDRRRDQRRRPARHRLSDPLTMTDGGIGQTDAVTDVSCGYDSEPVAGCWCSPTPGATTPATSRARSSRSSARTGSWCG